MAVIVHVAFGHGIVLHIVVLNLAVHDSYSTLELVNLISMGKEIVLTIEISMDEVAVENVDDVTLLQHYASPYIIMEASAKVSKIPRLMASIVLTGVDISVLRMD